MSSPNNFGMFFTRLDLGNTISQPADFSFFNSFAFTSSIVPIIFIPCLFNSDINPTEKNTGSSKSITANNDLSTKSSGLVFSSQNSTFFS